VHELSIARGVVDLVETHVPPARVPDVRRIRLRLGELSGVAADPLQSCFEALVAGTPLGAARLEIERRSLRIACRDCGSVATPIPPSFRCARCGGADVDTLSGDELDVTEVVLADGGDR